MEVTWVSCYSTQLNFFFFFFLASLKTFCQNLNFAIALTTGGRGVTGNFFRGGKGFFFSNFISQM